MFCEGITEKYYFEYFTDIIEKNKFNDIKIEIECTDGNSSRVLKFADSYMSSEENNRKYGNYKKYLVFDCDSPPNVQKVICTMIDSENKYELLVSNYLFETWLLMHFEDVNEKISKNEIYMRLSNYLNHDYIRASKGIIREIIHNGNAEKAMKNAEYLSQGYLKDGKDIYSSIGNMNPYSNVNIMVEQFLAAITLKELV